MLENQGTRWQLFPSVVCITKSTGLTDYIINFVFYVKRNKLINVRHVLFPVPNFLEVTIYTGFIEAHSSKVSNFSVCRVGRNHVYSEFLEKCAFSIMRAQEFSSPKAFQMTQK